MEMINLVAHCRIFYSWDKNTLIYTPIQQTVIKKLKYK